MRVSSRRPLPCLVKKQFGANVFELRKAMGMTQETLAEKADISTRYLQSLEAGEYFPALPTLVKLKKVLRADWNQLFKNCG